MREIFIGTYCFLLAYIALYGLHLYWLIALSSRTQDNKPADAGLAREYPHVTVQLPLYNERAVVSRVIAAAVGLDWPRERLEIQVLDDSDDASAELAANEVARWQNAGFKIDHIRRDTRDGFKAGALAHGLKRTRGEFIAIFDADNIPRPDFLQRLMGHFADPGLGLAQARWSFLNRDSSLLCKAQALFLDAHFLIEQVARSRGGLFMNFNGTAGIWRRTAIDAAGGWQSDTLTEDLDLSYRAQLSGWRMLFDETVDVPTELPAAIRSFKTQQYRWARGAVETGRKLLGRILTSPLPWRVKLAATFHLTQKTLSPAILLLAVLLIPALYMRMQDSAWGLLLIDLPVFIAGTGSMTLFYGLAFKRQRRTHPTSSGMFLPLLTSMGIALAANNTLAVVAGLFGRQRHFVRTPKSGTVSDARPSVPSDYRIGFDHTIGIEAVLALYSAAAVICALLLGVYPSVPFLLTFAFGFAYFTFQSIRERYA